MGIAVAIIPARGGSKRIPRKNLALCAGKPLIAHTFAAARSSHHLERILLSTEDDEIADYGRINGIEVPYLRPAGLAADDTPMQAVLQEILAWLDRGTPDSIDSVVLLQPTSPLRTGAHIDQAIELLRAHSDTDSVVSVVTPPHIFHPLKLLKTVGGMLVPYLDDVKPVTGSRNLPPVYGRNGPAILVMRPEIIRRGEIYGSTSLPYVMEASVSIDVDEPLDLEIADLLLRRRG